MKNVILCLALLPIVVSGCAIPDRYEIREGGVVAHGLSKHAVKRNYPKTGEDWQEENWGGAARVSLQRKEPGVFEKFSLQAGCYRHSLSLPNDDRIACYGTADYDEIEYERNGWQMRGGPVVGIVGGYVSRAWPSGIIPVLGLQGSVEKCVEGWCFGPVIAVHPTFGKGRAVASISLRLMKRTGTQEGKNGIRNE